MNKRKTTKISHPEQSCDNRVIFLIYDDHKEVSHYLSVLLNTGNRLHSKNEKSRQNNSFADFRDLVLSTGILPQLEAQKILARLNSGFSSNPISLVLCSAKKSMKQKVHIPINGSVILPVNATELQNQVNNLLELQKELHGYILSPTDLPEHYDPVGLTQDTFIGKVRNILEKNLDNDAFSINDLCSNLGVSRSWLYRRFSNISNIGICEYLKILRLNKARDLLSSSDMNITQVAFASGFKNLSYFSREFTLRFGITPKKMQKQILATLPQNKHC